MKDKRELCHCGRPLHYSDPAIKALVLDYIARLGPEVPVTCNSIGRTFMVPRHYIALHGIKAKDVPHLGFREITE